MDFGLTEEQQLLQSSVRQFVAGECPPPRLREVFDAGSGHDAALWRSGAELGLAGLIVPEPFGGAGLELLDLALVCEVLGGGALPGPHLGHALACIALQLAGSEAQQQEWLPRLATGEAIGTLALAEPDGAWEAASWTAKSTGGRLSGAKHFVPHGALADLLVVGEAGGGLTLVEAGAGGVEAEDADGIDRTRPVASLRFERAPCEALPGGSAAAPRVRDAGLALLAADAFGTAWTLLELTVEYAKTREQFGQPLAQFQAVKHQIANLATDIEPMRGLFWYAAHAWDRGSEDAERAAAIAKAHITDRCLEAAREAVQLHGGIGFTWECDVQIWFKRAMFDRAFLGSPDLHRERRAALGDW